MRQRHGGSARPACPLLGQWRGTQRDRPTRRPDEEALTRAVVALASQYGRYGYRRVTALLGTAMFMKNANTYGRTPDFWLELCFVAGGAGLLAVMRRRVFSDPGLDKGPVTGQAKLLAWGSLFARIGAIVAGRLIAYLGPALEF